jgi:hypothetical protein
VEVVTLCLEARQAVLLVLMVPRELLVLALESLDLFLPGICLAWRASSGSSSSEPSAASSCAVVRLVEFLLDLLQLLLFRLLRCVSND